MEPWLLAVIAKPFALLALLLLAYPIVLAVKRYMPHGRLKRLLLINDREHRAVYAVISVLAMISLFAFIAFMVRPQ